MQPRAILVSCHHRIHSFEESNTPIHCSPSSMDQSAGGANSTTTRKLTTDGKMNALELNGMAAACSAAWDGTALIATTTLDSVGLKFTDKMSLSADRKLLTSKIKIASPQGDADLTVVFERQ
jgi:hypothetical protein